MLSERMLTSVVRQCTNKYLKLNSTTECRMPVPVPGQRYMLYMHVPFCERLCPYCSFNRFPYAEDRARPYFANMRKEMLMLKDLGYDFDSVYIGGGTPTILLDELCDTIDLARETFSIKEVSSETNPEPPHPELPRQAAGSRAAFVRRRAEASTTVCSSRWIATISTVADRRSSSVSRTRARISHP